MSLHNTVLSLKENDINLHQNIFYRINNEQQRNKRRKSFSLQNQIADELKKKINYLNQQINQYKLLVTKLQSELKQKEKAINVSRTIICHQMSNEKVNKSLDKSLNKSQIFTNKYLYDTSKDQLKHETNNILNISILQEVVKILNVHCSKQITPILKEKLKRLTRLENFADCISSLRIKINGHVERPQSLKSNWRWLKQIFQNKQKNKQNKRSSSKYE